MGAAELISIEESQSEENSNDEDHSAESDSINSHSESVVEPSVWKISKVIVADDQILNIQVLKSHFSELALTRSVQYAFNGQ